MATKKKTESEPHIHDWRVTGAVIGERILLLSCPSCKAAGQVSDPSRVEYIQARHGNFDWKESARVTEIPNVL